MMLHLTCSHTLAVLQQHRADTGCECLAEAEAGHHHPPNEAWQDVLIPCHQDFLSDMQLEEHVRDVRGEINKDMKRAVRLAYGGIVGSKKNSDDKGGPRTEDDCEKALSLHAGTPLPHGA